jgi:integral membrane protein
MNAIKQLRVVALLEGGSLLVLLFVAMPLKYGLGWRVATQIVGSIHGLLVLLLAAAVFRVALERQWSARKAVALFSLSLVPFGAFVLARPIRRTRSAPTQPSTQGPDLSS